MTEEIQILVVEDEPEIRRFLRVTLGTYGYKLLEAANGKEAMAFLSSEKPNLIILDLGLPDIDGMDLARQLREWSDTPIIILSARDQEMDKITALDLGADDYLTKPFGVMELMARIRVALRHAEKSKSDNNPVFELGNVRVDMSKRSVTVGGVEVHLTPIEYKLLLTLINSAGKVVTRQQLLREVWGPGYAKEGHYLRVYMGQLRHKLEEHSAKPKYLMTEPGIGYRLRTENDAN
jgi:two-component system, OmpR family, KDP operon response regulator KdpE